jgi:genome maintenance exonuclease 1
MKFRHVDVELVEYPRVVVDGKRHYKILDNYCLPSITTVLGSTSDKSYLTEWRNRVGEAEANRITNNSAKRGTNLHLMCEDYLNNRQLSCRMPDALEMFYSVKPLLHRINNIHCQEAVMYSDILKIAGTVDCIAEFDGVLSTIDFKNSRRTKTEETIFDYFLQETFYSLAYQEITGNKISQIVTIIAVENDSPQVFVKHIRPYIKPLVHRKELYLNK